MAAPLRFREHADRSLLYIHDPDPQSLPDGTPWRRVLPSVARGGTAGYRLTDAEVADDGWRDRVLAEPAGGTG